MGNPKIDVVGKRYERIVIISELEKRGKNRYVLIRCDCGNEKISCLNTIRARKIKSCGCLRRETKVHNKKHGMSNSPAYKTWIAMKDRCLNQKAVNYKYYGGAGITICERWVTSFENFYSDMGERPSLRHTIDRKDNYKGYTPDNCVWATVIEQATNKRKVVKVNLDGIPLNINDFSIKTGISKAIIRYFTHKGIYNGGIIKKVVALREEIEVLMKLK